MGNKKSLYYTLKYSGLAIFSILFLLFLSLYFYSSMESVNRVRKKAERMRAKTEIYKIESSSFVPMNERERQIIKNTEKEWENIFSFKSTKEEIARKISQLISMLEEKKKKYLIKDFSITSHSENISIFLSKKSSYSPINPLKKSFSKKMAPAIVVSVSYVAAPVEGIKFAQEIISNAEGFDVIETEIVRAQALHFTVKLRLRKGKNV